MGRSLDAQPRPASRPDRGRTLNSTRRPIVHVPSVATQHKDHLAMSKLGIFATVTSIIGALTFATMTSSPVEAADACVHKDFKTELVKEACTKGQKEAKD